MPAVPVPRRSTTSATGSTARSSSARRRSARRTTGTSSGRDCEGRPPARLDRPLPVRLPRPEGAGQGDFRKVPNGLPGVEDRVDLLHDGGVVAGRIRRSAGSRSSRRRRRGCSGCTRGRARSPSARTRTSSSTTRTRPAMISAKTHHMDVDYSCYEGRKVQGAVRHRPVPRLGGRPRRRVHRPEGPRQVREARRRPTTPGSRSRPGRDGRDGPDARSLRVDANVGALAEVRDFIRSAAADAGAPAEPLEDLVQAVDEAATNTIVHGYDGAPGWIEVGRGSRTTAFVIRWRTPPRSSTRPRYRNRTCRSLRWTAGRAAWASTSCGPAPTR